ncbi:MAG: hypothetical protein GXO30_08025 [Epsilonproteobacteria bacterium]|nr:hypothetical protein [Campylobacterota bacterium]
MSIVKKLKIKFLLFFRDIFVYHNSSLEFRAKLLAAMIGANKKIDECEEKLLSKIAHEIYPDDEARVDMLIDTTKEYVYKIVRDNELELNELIINIEHTLKEEPRFHEKINLARLTRFYICSQQEEDNHITQTRILEFLHNEIQEYKKTKKV